MNWDSERDMARDVEENKEIYEALVDKEKYRDMDLETAIYGASDDLIEIDGKIQEELGANHGEPTLVDVGDWEFEVEYGPRGIWHIDVIDHPLGLAYREYAPGELDRFKDYSEVILFEVDGDEEVHGNL